MQRMPLVLLLHSIKRRDLVLTPCLSGPHYYQCLTTLLSLYPVINVPCLSHAQEGHLYTMTEPFVTPIINPISRFKG